MIQIDKLVIQIDDSEDKRRYRRFPANMWRL